VCWICFDFNALRIEPTHYVKWPHHHHHLKSRTVEDRTTGHPRRTLTGASQSRAQQGQGCEDICDLAVWELREYHRPPDWTESVGPQLPGSRCLQTLEGGCQAAGNRLGETPSSLSLQARPVRRERKLPTRRRVDSSDIRPAVYRTQHCVRRSSQQEAKPPTKRIESRSLTWFVLSSRAFLSAQSAGARPADSGHGLGRNRHFASPLLVTVPFNLQCQRPFSIPTAGCRRHLSPSAQICFFPYLLPHETLRAL
jgi:hypothetical protein